LLENWNIKSSSDLSRNHIMFGEIGAWFFKGIGGIFPDPESPGFKNVILKPNFVDGLQFFEAEHIGPYGKIVSGWERQSDKSVKYNVVIPPNSTATVFLKAKKITIDGEEITSTTKGSFNLKSGDHSIIIEN